MLTRFVATILFLLAPFIASSQVDRKNTLTQQQVTNLDNQLRGKIADTTRFRIQIRLAKYFFDKGFSGKTEIDSVASLLRQAREINTRQFAGKQQGLILLYEAMLARRTSTADSARQIFRRAINQLRSSNEYLPLAEAYLELACSYDSNDPKEIALVRKQFDTLFMIVPKFIPPGQLDSCMATLRNFFIFQFSADNLLIRQQYLDQYIRTCETLNDKIRQFWARKERAYIIYDQGDLNFAINDLLKVAKEQKDGNYPYICYTYERLCFYYYIATNYEKSLFYGHESLKNVRNATDSAYMGQIYSMVAINYRQRGNTAEAVEWNIKMIGYMKATGEYSDLYLTLYELARDMIPLGRASEILKIIQEFSRIQPPRANWEKINLLICLAQSYEALPDIPRAEKYSDELIALIDDLVKQKRITGDARAYIFLATFYMNRGKYDKSEAYFKKAMSEWPKGAPTQGREYEHRFMYRLDSARGDFRSAFIHIRIWHRILDSALNATKAKQLDEIKISYQTEQKDSLINLKEQNIQLLTKQDLLQKNKLQQGSMIRNISLTAAGLSIVIMALLYNSFRQKKRINKRLEVHQMEIEEQNTILRRVINEKEWLVKEIHHRVKNNLQIIMSLLNSQSAYIDNGPALSVIHDSQHRVHAMSLIHQKLYNAENVSSIDIELYIRELASYLLDSFNAGQRIRMEFDIDPLEMDVNQAVPLGLILNEAITNSIKYAFPGGKNGIISTSLKKIDTTNHLLIISDNGIGISPTINKQRPGSLGMSLIEGLAEDLNGSFSIENNNGTTIKILFELDFEQGVFSVTNDIVRFNGS